jgi:SsrA-binding protein
MSAQKKEAKRYTEIRNSKALHDYFVDERFEAGIQLRGTEVKSIRAGKAQITGAFGRCDNGELWLHNVHIDPYAFGNTQNHEPRRTRKLLLHHHQIRKNVFQGSPGEGGNGPVHRQKTFRQARGHQEEG